jgi:hypothetical protein
MKRITSMNERAVFDQNEEDILVPEVSDEAIEAAAGPEQALYTPNLLCGLTNNPSCGGGL